MQLAVYTVSIYRISFCVRTRNAAARATVSEGVYTFYSFFFDPSFITQFDKAGCDNSRFLVLAH
jgi:hypothetical protein